MNKAQEPKKTAAQESFSQEVGKKEGRRLKAKRKGDPPIWRGLGMMGLIGWSVAGPTLLGVALGMWLDRYYPGERSWTLALLAAGLAIGCWNAWRWVAQEEQSIREDNHNGKNT